MTFVHYSGAGNTFLLADNRTHWFDPNRTSTICHQKKVDGLILVEHSQRADVAMRIFNRDGSEAEMCGNGLRCFIRFLQELGFNKTKYCIQTAAGIQQGWTNGDEVCTQLCPPTDLKLDLPYDLYFLNTGVPHAVLFVESVEHFDIAHIGRALRFSPQFAPAGANINFACPNADNSLTVRTYERGVEAETLACGTGSVAVALIAHKVFQLPSPISIHVRSGQTLTVFFNCDWSEVILQGPAVRVGAFEMKE